MGTKGSKLLSKNNENSALETVGACSLNQRSRIISEDSLEKIKIHQQSIESQLDQIKFIIDCYPILTEVFFGKEQDIQEWNGSIISEDALRLVMDFCPQT